MPPNNPSLPFPLRKRDRLRNLFHFSPPLPLPSPSPSSSSAAVLPFSPSALSTLKPSDRDLLLRVCTENNNNNNGGQKPGEEIDAAIHRASEAAKEQEKDCARRSLKVKGWRGKEIVLREEADKVVRWIERFVSVGDVVANVDPVHIGLPWAGIRVVLNVLVADSKRRAALLTGMGLALHVACRLKAYHAYLRRLPPDADTTGTFEKALVKLYVMVLRFLDRAVGVRGKNSAARVWDAIWEESELDEFEAECRVWTVQVEIDAGNCDRDDTIRWRRVLDDRLRDLDKIADMHESLVSMHTKFDLAKLRVAEGATYNSYKEEGAATCLEGTRVELLEQIIDWAAAPKGRPIFWLCGKAGTGKSTISRTVARMLDQRQRLGASFFFKRGEGDRGNAGRFFTTVAKQLADNFPGFGRSVADALEEDSLLSDRNLKEQFEKLIQRPLSELEQKHGQLRSSSIALVIDALDECERHDDIRTLLKFLSRSGSTSFHIFVTSRPELPVKLGFKSMDGDVHQDVVLEQVQATTIEQDLEIYFKHRLSEIKKEDSLSESYYPLPEDWPGDGNVEKLVKLALPLFIVAFTICQYVAECEHKSRLNRILELQEKTSLSGLNDTYLTILDQLLVNKDDRERVNIIQSFRALVGPIAILEDSLSAISLSSLLDISLESIDACLKGLHSVLNIPPDPREPIRFFHLSFREFLISSRAAKSQFYIDAEETHLMLLNRCLHSLSRTGTLRENICGLDKPGTRRLGVEKSHIANSIPADVTYACSYWVFHLVQSDKQIHDGGLVHEFLETHFLHWMEALSWLGRLSEIITHVDTLRSLIDSENATLLSGFLEDASHFVLQNRYVVDLAPLQLYSSALIFAPENSMIKQKFRAQHPTPWLKKSPKVPLHWSMHVPTLEGYSGYVGSLAFSPNGRMLASVSVFIGSTNGEVRIWNTNTGEEMHLMELPDAENSSLAFSPDSRMLACGAYHVSILDVVTGESWHTIESQESWLILDMAFSPDCQTLVWVTYGGEVFRIGVLMASEGVQVGCVPTEVMSLEYDESTTFKPALSRDTKMLALVTTVGVVEVWNLETGRKVWAKSSIDMEYTLQPVFSTDGQTLAIHTHVGIELWDIIEDTMILRTSKKYSSSIHEVAFFEGHTLALYEMRDDKVLVIDAATGEILQTLVVKERSAILSTFAFSPDGHTMASDNGLTIDLWDASKIGGLNDAEESGHVRKNLQITGETVVTLSNEGPRISETTMEFARRILDVDMQYGVRVLDASMEQEISFIPFASVSSLDLSSDRQTLAVSHGAVTILNALTGEQLQIIETSGRALDALFSPDGRILAIRSAKAVQLWNIATCSWIERLSLPRGAYDSMAFSADGQIFTLAIKKGKTMRMIFVWNVSTAEEIWKFKVDSGCDRLRVALSPNGELLAAPVVDEGIHLWDVSTQTEVQKFECSGGDVQRMVFSPDGKLLAAVILWGRMILFEVATGNVLHAFSTHDIVDEIEFTPDGSFIVSNAGVFDLRPYLPSPELLEVEAPCLFRLQTAWLLHNDEEFLWLPSDHRPSRSRFYGKTLVIWEYQTSRADLFRFA